jgi:integrase
MGHQDAENSDHRRDYLRLPAMHIDLNPDTRLAQNRSGYWEIRWTEHDAATGRARTRAFSCRTKDRGLAEDAHRAWLDAASAVGGLTPGALLVRDVLERYIRDHIELNLRGSTTQRGALKPVLDFCGNQPLTDVTPDLLRRYRRHRARTVADATARREMGAMNAALKWAKRNSLLPADWVPPHFDLPPNGAPRENVLTEAEAQQVWDAASSLFLGSGPFASRRIGLFICLALDTAARAGSIEGLTWDRVNMAGGFVDYRDPGRRVSRKRRVLVPISDRLQIIMQAAYDQRATIKNGKYVLGNSADTHMGFRQLMDGMGLHDCTRHDLRRTWATIKARRGVPLWEIAGVLGDTIATVTKHYAHHCPGHLRSAVNA